MGDYAKVKALCDDQVHEKMDMMSFHRVCFESAFVQGDQPAMEGFLQWAHGNTEEGEAFAYSAWVAVYRGRISDAKILFRQAERIALQSKSTELAADIALDQAMLEAEVGLFPAARADARKVLKLPFESALEQAYAARALARAGDKSLALTVAKKAESMAPLNDLIGATMLPTVRGAVYLQEADPADALKALEESRQFDLCTCMELAPGYYRGLAYLQNKQPELAVREFQQVIDHRFLSTTFSVYLVLSQLELGHAYQLLGDSRSANSAFTKVELAWKDADPSFPPLQTLRQYKELLPISEQR
jgi:tetratricopeptide (TPR) repeat protein